MLLVEIRDFKALIGNKPFFQQCMKDKQEIHEKLIEMTRNDDYTNGNLLVYLYRKNYYKLIAMDLSRRKKSKYSSKN